MEEMRIYIVFFSVFEVDKKIWIFLCFLWKDLVYYRSWSENLLITDNCFDHLLSQNAPDSPVSASQLWGFVAFLCLLWWWSEPFGVLDCWLEASSHRNYVGHDCFIDWMLVKRHCLLCWHFSVQIIFFIAPGPTCVQRQRPVDRRRKSSHPLSVKAEGHLHHHPLCLFHTGFTPLPHVWGVYVCTTQFFFFCSIHSTVFFWAEARFPSSLRPLATCCTECSLGSLRPDRLNRWSAQTVRLMCASADAPKTGLK